MERREGFKPQVPRRSHRRMRALPVGKGIISILPKKQGKIAIFPKKGG